MNRKITEDSTRHCRTDQVASGTYSLPSVMTEKRGNIHEDICSSAHLFLAKNTCTKPKNSNFFLNEWGF